MPSNTGGRPYKRIPAEEPLNHILTNMLVTGLAPEEDDAPSMVLAEYYDSPRAFVQHAFVWPVSRDGRKTGPNPYQCEILDLFPKHARVAVRGPHGLGKTTLAAWIILWFAFTREAKGVDWKVATTAGSWHQLTHYLWPEIHKWARLIRPDWARSIGFSEGRSLMQLSMRLAHGEGFGVASNRHELIEGAHATEILYCFDEAKSIAPPTWDAAEGAFAGGGTDTDSKAFALATSTPGAPAGRFYDINRRAEGFEDWRPRHVTLEEAITAGRISREWAEARLRQWGQHHPLYQNRVLGNFAADDEDAIIPLAWVEAAQERFIEWSASAKAKRRHPVDQVGCDIGRGGNQSAFAPRSGNIVLRLIRINIPDTMQIAGHIKVLLLAHPEACAAIDVNGLGAGVYDRLREENMRVWAFNAGAKSPFKDRSGQMGFINRRAEAWWRMRELLDPGQEGEPILLPADDTVIGDLTAPRWWVTSGGNIQVEAKVDIEARIGRSTDYGDAIIESFAPEIIVKAKKPFRGGTAGPKPGQQYVVR